MNPETNQLENSSLQSEISMALKVFELKILAANIKKYNISKTTVFLTSMSHYKEMNSLYATFFDGHKPARSCVAVKELPAGAMFEIEAIGVVSNEDNFKIKL